MIDARLGALMTDDKASKREEFERLTAWALLIFGVAVMRMAGLAYFPGVMADEGLWTSSSKNFVMFGDWFMDGRTHALLSPVFHGMSVAVYRVMGASIANARLISALASTVSVPLLYHLVHRTSGDRDVAFTSAVIMGLSATYAFAGRQAMIEATQIAFSLLAAWLVARGDYKGSVLGGAAFGLALLTKINIAFLTPVLILLALPRCGRVSEFRNPRFWARAAVFAGVAAALAGTGNLLLYFAEPELYMEAYRFELVGTQFESISNPIIQIGRFGLDPSLSARSLIALIREAPFQMVFCAVGVGAVAFGRLPIHPAFWAWLLWGTGFVLIQNFQPLRYFFLTAPAYCFFAAMAIHRLADAAQVSRWFVWNRVQTGVLVVYAVFNIGYLGMNAVANPDRRLQTVREWVVSNTEPSDRIIAASYFSVDLPNRAYAHYHLGGSDIDALATSIEEYQIDYIIYDDGEWTREARSELERRYDLVKEWPFGAVFRVRP